MSSLHTKVVLSSYEMTEIHPSVFWQVMEEMRREREDGLRSQGDSLAMQMATIHYQKAERRTKVLQTCGAMLTLHSLLILQLRERKSLERQDVAQSIQNHCLVGNARLPS